MSDEPQSRKPVEVNRDDRGRLLPGSTANPSGRPKVVVEVMKRLEEGLPEAATALLAMLKDDDPKVKMFAVREVFDRVMGKPKQAPEDNDALERAWEHMLSRLRGGGEP